MIRTIIQISVLRLWHNKPELVLTFLVPILFFSIFAWIFGSRGSSGSTPQLKIAFCDEVGSPANQHTIRLLDSTHSVRLHPSNMPTLPTEAYPSLKREVAEGLVKRGLVNAAIVFKSPDTNSRSEQIEILTDTFDQVAGQVIVALVQKSSIAAQIERNANQAYNIRMAGSPTVSAVAAADFSTGYPTQQANAMAIPSITSPAIDLVDVLGAKKTNPMIAMYAAGIAVMFVLFSATTAGGALLEERENSTLERLLCSGMTIDHLLMGKWCYLTCIGIFQTTLMFGFGAIAFKLELLKHLDGFIAMTVVTSGAAAGFALMLATMSRTRSQLGWISTIVILSMSALGGSMVPRYLMSESIQRVGQFTFNAWALDGYNKIFWRELPLIEIRQELCVLLISGLAFIIIARLFATRWERG
jgi:ABC-2 type transport system permease protein